MRIVLGKYTDDKIRNTPNIPYRIAADSSGISPMGVSCGMRNNQPQIELLYIIISHNA